MSSDNSATHVDIESMKPGTSESSFISSKGNKGKVPKRIHKSEREKLKREHLNDLFLNLASALDSESSQQNIGKASVLSETARFLKDLLDQAESLKREHKALLSESKYVMEENNELREEVSVLGSQMKELENQIEARKTKPDLNVDPPETEHPAASERSSVVFVTPFPRNVSKPHARYPTPSDSWPSQLLG